jgi:hypothetical protein
VVERAAGRRRSTLHVRSLDELVEICLMGIPFVYVELESRDRTASGTMMSMKKIDIAAIKATRRG